MRAARYSNVGVVGLLLAHAACANEKDITGKTTLQYAEERSRSGESEEGTYQRVQIARSLRAAAAE